MRHILILCVALAGFGAPTATCAQALNDVPDRFDIPAEALEDALKSYSQVAHVQLLYSADLVKGKVSSPVHGNMTPDNALALLLRGTDLRVRVIGSHSVTLAAGNDPSVTVKDPVVPLDPIHVRAKPMLADSRRFSAYANALLLLVTNAIRQSPVAGRGSYEMEVRVWLDASGVITRTDVIHISSDGGRTAAVSAALRGKGTGEAPPADLPQPVDYAIRVQAPH
jgi:hypothetical protein